MGEIPKPEIRETYRETVANRVPYYGESLVETDDGEWVVDDNHFPAPVTD